jgi:preprotein translocase subunit YajC
MGSIMYLLIIVAVFYFFLIAPEKKKQNKAKEMMRSLKVGDFVITRGGIQGTIVELDDVSAVIATGPDKAKISITRQAVGTVTAASTVEEEEEEYEEYEEEYEEDDSEEEVSEGSVSLDKK